MFDIAAEDAELLAPFMLDFGVLMVDISMASAETFIELPMPPEAQVVLFFLRFGRTREAFLQGLPKIAPALHALLSKEKSLVFATLIVYLKTVGKMSETEVCMALQNVLGYSEAVEEILFGPERRTFSRRGWHFLPQPHAALVQFLPRVHA